MSILTNKNSRAFTLVEMIVSLAVFSIVAVVALGALTKIVSANRKAQTLQTSITNLNFALETMSRELRVSPYYDCQTGAYSTSGTITASRDCAGGTGSAAIGFLSPRVLTTGSGAPCNAIYVYAFKVKSDGTYDLQKAAQGDCETAIPSSAFSSIIDPNVVITGYYLSVLAAPANPGYKYPLATIRISGYAGTKEREKTLFDVQTSVSPRTI